MPWLRPDAAGNRVGRVIVPGQVWNMQLKTAEGQKVARCTVWFDEAACTGVRRIGKRWTTLCDATLPQPADRVNRHFAPVRIWVADHVCGRLVRLCLRGVCRGIVGWPAVPCVRMTAGLIHQSVSVIRYTERFEASVGSVGDSYDNALAETIIGL